MDEGKWVGINVCLFIRVCSFSYCMPDRGTQTRPSKFKRFIRRVREAEVVVEFLSAIAGFVAIIVGLLVVFPGILNAIFIDS